MCVCLCVCMLSVREREMVYVWVCVCVSVRDRVMGSVSVIERCTCVCVCVLGIRERVTWHMGVYPLGRYSWVCVSIWCLLGRGCVYPNHSTITVHPTDTDCVTGLIIIYLQYEYRIIIFVYRLNTDIYQLIPTVLPTEIRSITRLI